MQVAPGAEEGEEILPASLRTELQHHTAILDSGPPETPNDDYLSSQPSRLRWLTSVGPDSQAGAPGRVVTPRAPGDPHLECLRVSPRCAPHSWAPSRTAVCVPSRPQRSTQVSGRYYAGPGASPEEAGWTEAASRPLQSSRKAPDTDIAPAKRTLVCTAQRQNKGRARVSGGAQAAMPTSERVRLRQAQKDTQRSDRGGRPGRRVKANLCSLFLQTRRRAKLSTRTS